MAGPHTKYFPNEGAEEPVRLLCQIVVYWIYLYSIYASFLFFIIAITARIALIKHQNAQITRSL